MPVIPAAIPNGRAEGGNGYEHHWLTEVLSTAHFLVTAECQVVSSNAPAQTLLARADALHISGGRLCLADAQDCQRLHEAVRQATVQASFGACGVSAILRVERLRSRHGYFLSVAAVNGFSARQPRSVAAVFVNGADDANLPSPGLLRELFGFTRAEADLAGLLAQGSTLQEAARSRNISVNTVRTQLRSLFGKTGVARQADLLRLLLSCTTVFLRRGTNP